MDFHFFNVIGNFGIKYAKYECSVKKGGFIMANVNNYEKTAMKVSIVSIIWNLILSVGKLFAGIFAKMSFAGVFFIDKVMISAYNVLHARKFIHQERTKNA